jgi:hypothetical protein
MSKRKSLKPNEGAGAAKVPRLFPVPKNKYAVGADGECMSPAIPDGTIACCDPAEPPRAGDFVVIWLRHPTKYSGLLKRLVSEIPHNVQFPFSDHPESEVLMVVLVESFNPPLQHMIPCSEVLVIHKVVGRWARPSRAKAYDQKKMLPLLAGPASKSQGMAVRS